MAAGEQSNYRIRSSSAGMRPTQALCPSRLAGLVLLALTTATTGHYQDTLICRQPETQVCFAWLVNYDELQNFNNAESLPSLMLNCGFSTMQAVSPYQEFYEVSQLNKNQQAITFHCQRIILLGDIVDLVKLSSTLSSARRFRRQTFTPRGRYRGQTQSQYLAIDRGNGKDEGKAEAHSAADSSRASVSGNSGMGQAQSQTIYDPNCEDCYRRPQVEVSNLKHPGSSRPVSNGYGQNTDTSWPAVNQGQSNYIPNHAGYNPVGTQGFTPGKDHSTTSGSQSPGFYGPKPKNEGYGGAEPNGNIDYRPSGTYGRPTDINGNVEANNRPIDPSANVYEPNNINGYDTKNVPGKNYKSPGNVGGGNYRPIGSGTNSYLPSGNGGVYDPVRNVNTNPVGNLYSSRYPNQGVSFTPGDSTGGGAYHPTDGNSNRFGGTSSYDRAIAPNQHPGQEFRPGQTSEQGLGPVIGAGQGSGQEIKPGQGTGPVMGPGQGAGQVIRPGQGSGQRIEPGIGQGIQAWQGPGQSQGVIPGQGLEPGQAQGVGPIQGQGVWPGSGQGVGPGSRQGVGPGSGQGAGPGSRQGVGPGSGQGVGPGFGPGVGPGSGQGLGPGSGQGLGPGSGQGVGPGFGQGLGPGSGQGVGPGFGQGVGPGSGQGLGPGSGQGLGPGSGQGVGPGFGQGVGPGSGQGLGPGSGQGVGPQYGIGQVIPGQNADNSQNSEYGPNHRGSGTEYGPYQTGLGPRYEPNQGNLGSEYRPVQSGLGSGPLNTGPNRSISSSPYGPNTETTGNLYPNHYGLPNAKHGQSNIPSGQLGSDMNGPHGATNQYDGHLGTGTSNIPTTGYQYRPDGSSTSTLTQPYPYGTQFDTTSSLEPGGQLATGSGPNIGNQYNTGLGTNIPPSNYGIRNDLTRPSTPDGQLGTGAYNGPTVGGTYGPAVIPNNVPNGPSGIGSGPYVPGGQYNTNVGKIPQQQYGTFIPQEQNGGRGPGNGNYNVQPSPGGQYNKVINSDISPGHYGSGNIVPGGQVGPGSYIGQHGTGTHFGPVDNSHLTSPRDQYGPGSDILGTFPGRRPILTGADQNEPAYYPATPYGAGSLDGPKKSNGLGTTGPNSPHYTGIPNVQGQPYGSDRVNVPSYGNGNLNYNSITPGGQGGKVGGENGGMTNGQDGSIPNKNGAPIDGTPGSQSRPYNSEGTSGQANEYGTPQNYIDPNSIDGDDSEAEASVAQGINGTTASASSKGGNDKGRAQTNVHGTYTGSGSFQAQAQITSDSKQAQSEVSGGKKGASSTASGSGRNNKSQANVQLGSETGSVQTQSQSAGVMHSSNSQVQGSVKGGMADAQAKGPGSTSSQAQIGFTPYKDTDKPSHDLQKTPFSGGGVASAQSSGRTGQSQSQLHGTFKYGITYNGAAQSGASLDKDAVFSNRLSFKKIDVYDENEKNIDVDITETPQSLITEISPQSEPSTTPETYNVANDSEVTTTENVIDETMIDSEGSHTHLDHHKSDGAYLSGPTLSGTKKSFSTNHINNPGTDYEFSTVKDDLPPESDYDTDEPYNPDVSEESDLAQGEYPNYDGFTRESPTHQSLLSSSKPLEVRQSTGSNTQHIVLGSLKNRNAEIIQKSSDRPDENKVYLSGERIPGTGGYIVPAGFTGSVKSVASKDNTYVVGYRDSPSQAQTVTLTPGTGKVKYMYPPAYGKHVMPKNLRSLYSPKDDNKYLSVSKSVTRALDNENNIRKQYSHTYYTKSSSCGYFTFTCTMVSSAEGRKKVCKPKIPTNPDGTQIRC